MIFMMPGLLDYFNFTVKIMIKMKKIIPILLLLFCIKTTFAQEVKIGISLEPQLTWLSTDTKNVNKDGSYFGINGGLVLDKYFRKNYALHTGISIGTQGGGLRFDSPSTIETNDSTVRLPAHTSVDYKLQYITIPLGLKLRTNQIGYFTYYVLIGFTNQFKIKGKASSSDNTLSNDLINKEIGFYNLGYHFGAGAEYAISQDTALSFGLVYNNGFIDLTKNNGSIKSRVLSLNVGIMF
jgi:opacity protein-like surface antigen